MNKSVVQLQSKEGGLGVLVPHLLTSGMNQADVKIITADGFRFMAHSVSFVEFNFLRKIIGNFFSPSTALDGRKASYNNF